VIIVFITALARYAIEGYKVNALDFILKPVVYEQLVVTMDRVLKTSDKFRKDKTLIVLDDGAKRKVSVSDIYYIEVVAHDVFVHCSLGTLEHKRSTLTAMAEELSDYNFVKAGQSQLVNLKYVDQINGDIVRVHGEDIYLSRSQKKNFLAAFAQYVGAEI
jgi:DNA-binding LytR/AlgR family response regulator